MLVSTWFRLSELLASPGQPGSTRLEMLLRVKKLEKTSHGSNDVPQLGISEHMQVVCQLDGQGGGTGCPAKLGLIASWERFLQNMPSKDSGTPSWDSNLPGVSTCKNPASNHICHLWHSKISHLITYYFARRTFWFLKWPTLSEDKSQLRVPAHESKTKKIAS